MYEMTGAQARAIATLFEDDHERVSITFAKDEVVVRVMEQRGRRAYFTVNEAGDVQFRGIGAGALIDSRRRDIERLKEAS